MEALSHHFELIAMEYSSTRLRIIAKYYRENYTFKKFSPHSFIIKEGVFMLGISDAAKNIGFRTSEVRISFQQLVENVPTAFILHWNQNHIVAYYKIKKAKYSCKIEITDSQRELANYLEKEFKNCWLSQDTASTLTSEPKFHERENEREKKGLSLRFFFYYLVPHQHQLVHLILGILIISILQLILLFPTQSLVYAGIRNNNLKFITLISVAQLIISSFQVYINSIHNQIKKTLLDTALEYQEKRNTLKIEQSSYAAQLLATIQNCKLPYAIQSSIEGKISFTHYKNMNQKTFVGKVVFNITLTISGQVTGKTVLPTKRSGNIKVRYKAYIRFDDFPDNKSGFVYGKMEKIYLVPTENKGASEHHMEIYLLKKSNNILSKRPTLPA